MTKQTGGELPAVSHDLLTIAMLIAKQRDSASDAATRKRCAEGQRALRRIATAANLKEGGRLHGTLSKN